MGKKIFVVNNVYTPHKIGGAEETVRIINEKLVEFGNDVTVFTIAFNRDDKKKEVINGVNVVRFPLYNIYNPFARKKKNVVLKIIWHAIDTFNIFYFIKFLLVLKKERPDILWTNNLSCISPSIWMAAKLCGITVVHSPRDYYLLCYNNKLYKNGAILNVNDFKLKAQRIFRAKLSSLVDGVIGISDFMHDIHVKNLFFNKKYSKTIYNPVYLSLQPERFTQKKQKNRVFGYLGGEDEAKGWLNLERIFPDKYDGCCKLIAAGYFSENIKNSKNIKVVNRVNNLEEFFKGIDVLLVPSKWEEPFGRVVLEALAFRTPVLVSDRGGLSELATKFASVKTIDFDNIAVPEQLENLKIFYDSKDIDKILEFEAAVVSKEYEVFFEYCMSFSKKEYFND